MNLTCAETSYDLFCWYDDIKTNLFLNNSLEKTRLAL